MGSDGIKFIDSSISDTFQSTLPAWGATYQWYENQKAKDISIHAPRMGSDRKCR